MYFCKEFTYKWIITEQIMPKNAPKSLKMFYSISEVAEEFGVAESLLRYWEDVFPSIRPKKSGSGKRMYTEADIEAIRVVHNLVKVRGMKLESAKSVIEKNSKGASDKTAVIEKLQGIREELQNIREILGDL